MVASARNILGRRSSNADRKRSKTTSDSDGGENGNKNTQSERIDWPKNYSFSDKQSSKSERFTSKQDTGIGLHEVELGYSKKSSAVILKSNSSRL